MTAGVKRKNPRAQKRNGLVNYQASLPAMKDIARAILGENLILIYDERLAGQPQFKKWIQGFHFSYPVRAGENLKQVDDLALHIKRLLPLLSGYAPRQNVIVAAGGGSVGDFAGFMASILKRGVGYVNIPSSWLAAVDSAHGGKTGLNVDQLKNQVGSFYPAQKIYCVKELLFSQPDENVHSAYGEVLKMGLIEGASLFNSLERLKTFDAHNLWKVLPRVVEAKSRIVRKDPNETRGLRHILNFGHTVGHAFEMERLLPHGLAVQIGLQFAVEWSHQLKILKSSYYEHLKKLFAKNQTPLLEPLDKSRFHLHLKQDKKAVSGDRVRFVFLQKPGRTLIQEVKIDEVVSAACQMGWAQ